MCPSNCRTTPAARAPLAAIHGTYTVANTANTGDISPTGKTLTVSADVVAPRAFNSNLLNVSGTIGSAGGAISIPFTFTQHRRFWCESTTSVTVNNGGAAIVNPNGFATSGSYTFNGGQATIGNVTFNAATDTYTASGTITGTLSPGATVTGILSLPVTTNETGLGDTYSLIMINYVASSAGIGGNNSVLAFNPTTASFGRVLQGSTATVNATLTNGGISAGNYTGVTSNNGLFGPATGSIAAGPSATATVPLSLQNNANGSATVGQQQLDLHRHQHRQHGRHWARPARR